MKTLSYKLIALLAMVNCFTSCKQANNNDYLILVTDSVNERYGYKNLNGDTIIALGKYAMCYTDTLKNYAIVLKPESGFVAIDKNDKVLYTVFPFDNGPDYSSEGIFRIIENGKIGYADILTGKIIIKPQFKCAHPFENGKAKVSNDCEIKAEGEHSSWESNQWFYIDKDGKKVD